MCRLRGCTNKLKCACDTRRGRCFWNQARNHPPRQHLLLVVPLLRLVEAPKDGRGNVLRTVRREAILLLDVSRHQQGALVKHNLLLLLARLAQEQLAVLRVSVRLLDFQKPPKPPDPVRYVPRR